MAIPKTIYQTYKTDRLPAITRWHIFRLKKKNPAYDYQFYDDQRIDRFIQENFEPEVFHLYKRINIGAAKADFFRYAVLYIKGGIYLDIDSSFLERIDHVINPDDHAIISLGACQPNYVQWALFYEAGHPFLKRTLDLLILNLSENRYPFDVLKMTGPIPYTEAIQDCLKENRQIPFRQTDADYDGKLRFSYRSSKLFLYGLSRKNHWRKVSKHTPILKS